MMAASITEDMIGQGLQALQGAATLQKHGVKANALQARPHAPERVASVPLQTAINSMSIAERVELQKLLRSLTLRKTIRRILLEHYHKPRETSFALTVKK